MGKNLPILKTGTAIGIAFLFQAPIHAQTANPPSESPAGSAAAAQMDSGSRLDDIVVFGRKRGRAEELQQTPVAITALGPLQLQRSTVKDMVDVGRLAPNASLQTTAQKGVQNFFIRGMGVSGTSPSDEPAVGIFQDGVYWGSNYGALNELLDVEGIELLRGPQGTLFGRNVTGGAVTVRSARPSQTPYNRFTAGLSNGIGLDGSAVLNGPVSNTLSARLAVSGRYNEGLFRNIHLDKPYGKTSIAVVRPSVKWEPSTRFNLTVIGEYYHQSGDPITSRGVSPNTVPNGPRTLAEIAGYVTSPNYRDVQSGLQGRTDINVYFLMGEINAEIGPGTLTSITGYRKVSSLNITDYDGFPVVGFHQNVNSRQHQFSEELRYAADLNEWIGFTAGAYYFEQKVNYTETRDLNNSVTQLATSSDLDNSSYALFAEADIRPYPGLTLTVGGRYTHEKKVAITAPFGSCPYNLSSACNYQTLPADKADNFAPKVGLAYQIDPTKLVYASFTKGFRSGGFSLRGTPLASPYKSESVTAYEAGLKSDLFDRRIRFNLTGYYNKYDNLQRTVLGVDPILGTIQSVFNAADATIKGVEAELTVIPVTGLNLSGNFGYTDARYDRFAGMVNPQALQFVRVPKYTGNLSADYEVPLGNGDKIDFHLGGTYSGKYFFDDPNKLFQGGYWLLDANIAYTLQEDVTITAYTRNFTNKEYALWGSSMGALGQNLFPGDPRTYGVRLAVSF